MIVKIMKAKPAGTGRPLGTYILDLKHETPGERLGDYAPDPEKHKVEWARTVNTGVDEPRWAITAIEQHNARNLRAHKVSRWEHVIVSFPEGERPTRRQMEVIEDRLMGAIGFGDHPRLSAVHKPDGNEVANWHLHIAVSRIDPTTLKAEHPSYSRFALQAEAAKLEMDLGLHQERKTLLQHQEREIESRKLLERVLSEAARKPELVWEFAKESRFNAAQLNDFLATQIPDPVERQHVAERVYELRDKDLVAHWAPSGSRPLTLQDIARQLSPEYDKLLRLADDVRRRVIPKDDYVIRDREADVRLAEYRFAEREREIGPARAALHKVYTKLAGAEGREGGTILARILQDRELTYWTYFGGKAAHTVWAWQAHRAAHEGEWRVLIRRAEAALAAIRPQAEAELERRQKIAHNARYTLAHNRQDVILNQKRGHSIRAGP